MTVLRRLAADLLVDDHLTDNVVIVIREDDSTLLTGIDPEPTRSRIERLRA